MTFSWTTVSVSLQHFLQQCDSNLCMHNDNYNTQWGEVVDFCGP